MSEFDESAIKKYGEQRYREEEFPNYCLGFRSILREGAKWQFVQLQSQLENLKKEMNDWRKSFELELEGSKEIRKILGAKDNETMFMMAERISRELAEKDKEIAELKAALGQLGHMEEPEEFNHDQTYGFLFACEEVIKLARQALQNTKKEG